MKAIMEKPGVFNKYCSKKLVCIKDYIVHYRRGINPWSEQRLTEGKIYEISNSYIMGSVVPTYIDNCGTQRSLEYAYLDGYFISMEEYRERKLNHLIYDIQV